MFRLSVALRSLHPREIHSAAYVAFQTQFAATRVDDLRPHIARLSKSSLAPQERLEAHALMRECIERSKSLSPKLLKDACGLATSAELHEECVTLFLKRWETHRDDPSFVVNDAVVDAAYSIKRVEVLSSLAQLSAKRLAQFSNELTSDFMLWRCVWRLACLCAFNQSDQKRDIDLRDECLAAARKIWHVCVKSISPGLYDKVQRAGDPTVAAQPATGVAPVSDFERQALRDGFDGVFCRMQRLALYHRATAGSVAVTAGSAEFDEQKAPFATVTPGSERGAVGDDGEMKFFALVKALNFFRSDVKNASLTKLNGSIDAHHVEQFYFPLIVSCRRGLYVDQAVAYYNEYRGVIDELKAKQAELIRSAEENPLSAPPRAVLDLTLEMSESFLFQLFSVLQAARAFKKTLSIATSVLATTQNVSGALWSQILLAAGEEKNVTLCRLGYEKARETLVQHVSNSEGDVLAASGSRSTCEYLLQTSLHSLAKCHVPNIYEDLIEPCLQQNLLRLSKETIAYILTQNALHAPNTDEVLQFARAWMIAENVDMTTRIASIFFKVYLRISSEEMLPFYKEILSLLRRPQNAGSGSNSSLVFKRIWLDELILCSDRRRYFLTQDDRRYIASEIERVYGPFTIDKDTGMFSTKALEGLRTQVALLYHDLEHNGFAKYLDSGEIVGGSPLTDPRTHFLARKPLCCSHSRVLQSLDWIRRLEPVLEPRIRGNAAEEMENLKGHLTNGNQEHVVATVSRFQAAKDCMECVLNGSELHVDGNIDVNLFLVNLLEDLQSETAFA